VHADENVIAFRGGGLRNLAVRERLGGRSVALDADGLHHFGGGEFDCAVGVVVFVQVRVLLSRGRELKSVLGDDVALVLSDFPPHHTHPSLPHYA
jgi:hypothetical protein